MDEEFKRSRVLKSSNHTGGFEVRGKFIYQNNKKLYLKGVTYGTFQPQHNGYQFPDEITIKADLTRMADSGFNCIRTYTVPPTYLLDLAFQLNIHVMVGLPWEQHITFLDNAKITKSIIQSVRESVISCKKHPAILCYTIGNEIPSPIVRWHGKDKIESFLKKLFKTVKQVDPQALVTYVNYPTTEYLDLSFLDFDCFNVYLETPEKLTGYLSRLHNLYGDRPLVLAEIGLDSRRNGLEKQASTLAWQTEIIFGKGCAGMFVFSWTDEWWRGGFEIEDWDFGLVDRERNGKPALGKVKDVLKNIPFNNHSELPFISIIICSYNGSATIRETLVEIAKLNYKNYEVIVVNDGSTDNFLNVVKEFPVTLFSTENKGLSSARNTGLFNANGEIIAYIDDDAYPDSDWLNYIAYAYANSDHAAIGGPNIVPPDVGFISTCVANAPGGPVHVLITDEIAEHIPGCNMTFRREALLKIGGFDPQFRSAGDDVDVCWRIQQSGETIGFHPAALVWHHRRNSLNAYWKQQKGYGKAEALLEGKWPEKYNLLGHLSWSGRIYGNGFTLPIKVKKDKIFHGYWGTSLFQSVYESEATIFNSIPLMPEWYLLSTCMVILACMGAYYPPLLWMWPIAIAAFSIIIIQAAISSRMNSKLQPDQKNSFRYFSFIVLLHMLQPVARLYGRFTNGLTPWRKRGKGHKTKFLFVFSTRVFTHWSEEWNSAEAWLLKIERNLLNNSVRTQRGDDFAKWDILVRNGIFGETRGLLTIEEHGAGKQFLRFKCMPRFKPVALILPFVIFMLFIFAVNTNQIVLAASTLSISGVVLLKVIIETARSMNSLYIAFNLLGFKQFPKNKNEKNKESLIDNITKSLHAEYILQDDSGFFKKMNFKKNKI